VIQQSEPLADEGVSLVARQALFAGYLIRRFRSNFQLRSRLAAR